MHGGDVFKSSNNLLNQPTFTNCVSVDVSGKNLNSLKINQYRGK